MHRFVLASPDAAPQERKGTQKSCHHLRDMPALLCCASKAKTMSSLELIHRYVELFRQYFGSVSWTSFQLEKAYSILDEFDGDVQDTLQEEVLKAIEQADLLLRRMSRCGACW